MLGFAKHGGLAAERRDRVNQVGRIERCTTLFALIAICPFIFTVRAGASDIPVGQKLVILLIIILFGYLFDKFPFFIQVEEKLLRKLVMYLLGSTMVDIK